MLYIKNTLRITFSQEVDTRNKPEPWCRLTEHTQYVSADMGEDSPQHLSFQTFRLLFPFEEVLPKHWAKRSSFKNTPSKPLCYSPFPLSELIKNTLKSGTYRRLKGRFRQRTAERRTGFKGIQQLAQLWKWNEQHGKEQWYVNNQTTLGWWDGLT